MFIQTEETPNPLTIKFIPGREVLTSTNLTLDFPNAKAGQNNKLSSMLFENDGVSGVFLSNEYISVTKDQNADWSVIKPLVLGTIIEYYTAIDRGLINEEDHNENAPSIQQTYNTENLSDVEKEIIELIDTRIRPAVSQDGGDIIFEKFMDGIVYVRLQGACSGCPSSTATLKSGIENLLRHYVPEVEEVKAI